MVGSPTKARLRGGRLAFASALVCAWTAASPTVAPADAARPLTTGVSYVYENEPAAFANVRRTGARLTLTPLRWGDIAPNDPPPGWNPANPADPNYEWEQYDTWVLNAVAAGLTPVLQIRGAPLWANRCAGVREEDVPCDPDPAALAQFATAAALRYSGRFGGLPRVQYWQALNEPNLSLFFLPQFAGSRAVSPELYRVLVNAFYAAIKAVDPSNVVIAGGLGPIAVPKYTIGPMRFTRQLLCMRGHRRPRPLPGGCGAGVSFDVYDIHPYTTGSPTHEGGVNDVQLGDLEKLTTLLRAADRAGRINNQSRRTPLWITEISWDSNPPDPGGLAMPILTRWTAETLFTAWHAGVDTVMWYSLRDGERQPNTPSFLMPESGLFFRGATVAQDQPKESMYAFRFPFVAFPRKNGLLFWGRTPDSRGGKVVIQVRKPGGWRKLKAVRANDYGIFSGISHVRYGRNQRGFARAHYAGESSPPFSMRHVPDFRQPPFGAENALG